METMKSKTLCTATIFIVLWVLLYFGATTRVHDYLGCYLIPCVYRDPTASLLAILFIVFLAVTAPILVAFGSWLICSELCSWLRRKISK